MKISTRQTPSHGAFYVNIKSGDTDITEDVAQIMAPEHGIYYIDESIIEQFITTAREMSQFNGKNDLSFVQGICDAFLNDTEREELIEFLTQNK